MGAFVENTYKRGFFLTEESLIRIEDIIRSRISDTVKDAEISYRVYRSDGFFINYGLASDVVKEENSARNLVQEVSINVECAEVKIDLTFSKAEASTLRLEAQDRDLAFLLGSDLKEYLKAEVFVFRAIDAERMIIPLFAVIMAAFVWWFLFYDLGGLQESRRAAQELALASPSTGDKLDYLIKEKYNIRSPEDSTLFLAIGILAVVFVPLLFLKYHRTTINVFYWGKEVQRHDRRRTLHERIIWGIVVALVVGIAASFTFDAWKGR